MKQIFFLAAILAPTGVVGGQQPDKELTALVTINGSRVLVQEM
jgi:hypothetical protein